MTSYSKVWIAAFSLTAAAFAGCTNEEDLGARQPAASNPELTQIEYCANASGADASSCGNGAEKICQDQYRCLVNLLEVDAANVFLECQKPKICSANTSTGSCKEMLAQKAPLHTAESQKCF